MSIPEESIDLVARYLFSRDAAQSGVLRAWDQIPEASRRHYRTDAELALEHAAPYIAAQVWDEAYGLGAADAATYLDNGPMEGWGVVRDNPYRA